MNKLCMKLTAAVMTLAMAVTAFSAQAFAAEELPIPPIGPSQEQYVKDQQELNSISGMKIGNSPVSVNAYSGNVSFSLPGVPGTLTYNSIRNTDVGFGPAFTSEAFQTLEAREDSTFVWRKGDGTASHFYLMPGETEYIDEAGWRMYHYDFGGYNMYYNSNLHPLWDFNENGKITQTGVRAMNGYHYPQMRVDHDQLGRVSKAYFYKTDSYTVRETLTYAYNADNHVSSITNMAGTKYLLEYNAQGNLEYVKNAAGAVVIELQYDATGKLVTHIGSTHIQYDDAGRAVNVKVYNTDGTVNEDAAFAYSEGTTVVTRLNVPAVTYQFDEMGNQIR